ncbi:nitroreductase family protein [Pontixanthobacter gangjinensis]|uniref:Nitroreductase family protein n=1 Tax=Christiangramia aestuarii TaxID=1028746 RepID=A0A7K1LPD4_9FLAO|nr:nitroreductase family protein [Christiangramia aestuarii]MUP42491.1 nitroreductase family protein [Christiangramia aestuarii]
MSLKEKMINGYRHVAYTSKSPDADEMIQKSADFYKQLDSRRSVRHFSDREVPEEVIRNIIKTAGTAPSGAHKQPWKFCAVSNIELKQKIREAAEKEEEENYNSRMSERWLRDLAPLGTDTNKDFLEIAPWLIVVFKQAYEVDAEGTKNNNYYVNESVGIACGMLISAIHNAGLVTLTHTPSPMNFLAKLLDRPENERAFLLLPVGYAAKEAYVPDIHRKELNEICDFYK